MNTLVIVAVVIIVILFIHRTNTMRPYSWNDMKKRFENVEGSIRTFDLNRMDDEQSYISREIRTSYSSIFEHEVRPRTDTMMIKIKESSCTPEEQKLIDYVKPVIKNAHSSDTILRIQNSPWVYSSHFDCYDQYVYMLHGKKRWLLFDLDDLETERKLVLQFAGRDIETVSEILRANGIPFKLKTIHAGDVLFIPEGQYHLVENEGSQGTIFVNSPINKPVNTQLESKFESLWPKWYSGT